MRSFVLSVPMLILTVTFCLAENISLALGDWSLALKVNSCEDNGTYFLIDAVGDGATLSVVGSPEGDNPYTTIDLFLTEEGKDLRAGLTTGPILIEDGRFTFSGEVEVSDGSTRALDLEVTGCE